MRDVLLLTYSGPSLAERATKLPGDVHVCSVGAQWIMGISMPPGHHRGPVFDAGGRPVGIKVGGAADIDSIVLASSIRTVIDDVTQGHAIPALSTVNERMAVDEIYERALGMTVQVLAVQ